MSNSATIQLPEKNVDRQSPYDQYVAQQSRLVQTIHKILTFLLAGSMGLVPAIFIKALIVSIGWTRVNTLEIPFWWFAFAASVVPFGLFLGLDAILMRAVPPSPIGKLAQQSFTTGFKAILSGLGIIVVTLAWGGLHVAFAYSTLTLDWDVLDVATRGLGFVIGIGVTIAILSDLHRRFTQSSPKEA